MTFGPGTVNGFDITAFVNRFNQGGFFPLRDVASGSVAIDRAEVRATLAEGAARIEKAEAKLGERERRAVRRGALCRRRAGAVRRGDRAEAPPATPTTAEASFFVGGSWSAPVRLADLQRHLVRAPAGGRERLIPVWWILTFLPSCWHQGSGTFKSKTH